MHATTLQQRNEVRPMPMRLAPTNVQVVRRVVAGSPATASRTTPTLLANRRKQAIAGEEAPLHQGARIVRAGGAELTSTVRVITRETELN